MCLSTFDADCANHHDRIGFSSSALARYDLYHKIGLEVAREFTLRVRTISISVVTVTFCLFVSDGASTR
jgi:hypothetical protein